MAHHFHVTAALALVAALGGTAGCVDELAGDSGESVGETSEPVEVEDPCQDCIHQAWSCTCTSFNGPAYDPPLGAFFCWSGPEAEMDAACDKLCSALIPYDGYTQTSTKLACAVATPTDCTNWAPHDAVTYSTRTRLYEVDRALLDALVANAEPLWGCDAATVLALADGGFQVQAPAEGDLVDLLGLRDGDVLLSLNGYELLDYVDVVQAFHTLWFITGETSYTLEIERDARLMQLDYLLVGDGG